MEKKASSVLALMRWREHLPFSVPLTVLGAIIAATNGAVLDAKLIWVVLGNAAAVSYAFMINDIEDAEDDARDSHKQKRNPISAGRVSCAEAYTFARVLAIIALLFYLLTNALTFGIGVTTLVLSHLYSWRRVRLKAYPVVDILSHSLMLSGLLLLSGFSAFSTQFKEIWLLVAAASMFSVYGQLYNQMRDYAVDEKAGLKNTALLVGRRNTRFLMNTSVFLSVVTLLTSVYFKTFPIWLILPVALSVPLIFTFKTKTDSSGTVAIDLTGRLQLQLLLVFNILVLVWLLQIFVANLI